MHPRPATPSHPRDRGSTLLVSVLVVGVALSLSLLIVVVAITSGRTSGENRARLVAVSAAEAAVDAAYASIQSSALALPCTWPASGAEDVRTYPDTASATATITYYDTAGQLPCTGALAAGSAPVRAVISSVGATGDSAGLGEQRRMEALVNLFPIAGQGLNKAIFANGGVAMSNNATITGEGASNADVYSKGDFTCKNSSQVQGSLHAPYGTITLESSCSFTGDVWAMGAVVVTNSSTLGGRVFSSSSTVDLKNNTSVAGVVKARSAISWPGGRCGSPGKCSPYDSAVPPPPGEPFPELEGPATVQKWQQEGYQVLTDASHGLGCNARAIGDWIAARAETFPQKTRLDSSCAVAFVGTNLKFGKDFALFARGGISTSNNVSFGSTDESAGATPRQVHMIVPYDVPGSVPCTSPAITTQGQFTSSRAVTLLWYSKCRVNFQNNLSFFGAVYSGSQVAVDNQITLGYRPVQVFGLNPASAPPLSYKVDVVYKRETRLP